MVQIAPPPGWVPPATGAATVVATAATTVAATAASAAPRAPNPAASGIAKTAAASGAKLATALAAAPPATAPVHAAARESVPTPETPDAAPSAPSEPALAGPIVERPHPGWATGPQPWQKALFWTSVGGLALFVLGTVTGLMLANRDPAQVAEATPPAVDVNPASEPAATTIANSVTPPAVKSPAPPAAPTDDSAATLPSEEATQPEPAPAEESETPADEVAIEEEAAEEDSSRVEKIADPLAAVSDAPPAANLAPAAVDATAPADSVDPQASQAVFVQRRDSPSDAEPPDVAARLAEHLPSIRFERVALYKFLRFLNDTTGVPISLDMSAVTSLGVAVDAPVTVVHKNRTVAEALTVAVSALGLTYVANEGQIVVTSPAAAQKEQKSIAYPVSDLAADKAATAELARRLELLVAPTTWRSAGGAGFLAIEGDKLRISQTTPIHDQLVVFTERLREARGLPPRSRYPRERRALPTPLVRAERVLNERVTFTYHRPVRLAQVLRFVEDATGTTLLVDWNSAARVGIRPETELACSTHEQTLATTLAGLCGPLELAWRPLDAKRFEIFARPDEPARMQIELFAVGEKFSDGRGAEELRSFLTELTERRAGGFAEVDAASGLLIVRHSAPVALEIATFLAPAATDK